MVRGTKRKDAHERRIPRDETPIGKRWLSDIVLALLLTLFVEGLNMRSLRQLISYITETPGAFALSFLIELTFISIGELLRVRKAWIGMITLLSCGFGIVNYMCIVSRTTPLMPGDMILTLDQILLSTRYYAWYELLGIIAGFAAAVFGIILLFMRAERREHGDWMNSGPAFALLLLFTSFILVVSQLTGYFNDLKTDRVYAYKNHGFNTSFLMSLGMTGIPKPEAYSADITEEILQDAEESIEVQQTAVPMKDTQPNILFVQLESFFDVDTLIGAQYSEDVLPNYHALLEAYPNATLYMPSVGGGTANSELEVMTGMNVDFFVAGETPYNTILMNTTCESIAYILREEGYTSTAMHNNTGTFYSRYLTYANLGYDRFIPIEFMPEIEYASNGWAKDRCMIDQLTDVMSESEGPDLIFTITVESHGKYADTYEPREGDITVSGLPEEVYEAPMQNYINVLKDVDAFIGELTQTCRELDEPVIIVFYGDHLPGLGMDASMLTTGDLYASHYVIWNNYGAEFKAEDMQAYRLSAELLRQLGISEGVLVTFHQAYPQDSMNDPEYEEKLRTLQYDLLYGERTAYGEEGPYQPTKLQMGLHPVRVTSATNAFGRLLVEGENLNEFSRILCNGNALDTVYVDGSTVLSANSSAVAGDEITVAQIAEDGTELGRSNSVFCKTK